MKRFRKLIPLFLVVSGLVVAQRRGGFGGGGGYSEGGGWISEDTRSPREVASHSTGTPMWYNPKNFDRDVFTFARVKYDRGGFGRRGGGWTTDTPDSDLNLSFRLQQMTAMRTSPDGRFIRLTDPDLADYPFIYIVEPGGLFLRDDEVAALRKYLLNGGFLMLDDFWGDSEWANMEHELKKVFPDRSFKDLPLEHPIYHCVFEIPAKSQVPGISSWYSTGGDTAERNHDGDTRTVHHRVISDDKGRIMVMATHNTDNGDGWEREGENTEYFEKFSEKIAYPLGINIIFYVMTH